VNLPDFDPNQMIDALNTGLVFTTVARIEHKFSIRRLPPTAAELQFAEQKRVRLRVLVDEWLDTGKQPDGTESPMKRRLADLSGADLPCKDALKAFLAQHPPTVLLRNEGVPLARLHFEPFTGNVPDYWPIETHAAFLFFCMISSDWCYSIAKCRYPKCGTYFLLSNPNKSWAQGTFCTVEHNRASSAAKLTDKRRKDADQDLREEAARMLRLKISADRFWYEDHALMATTAEELTLWIAKKSSQPRLDISSKWLKWNREKIEDLVKRKSKKRSK
jgi:hypothetical protein